MRPEPDEAEIKWLLNEESKYLSSDLSLRRQDVLSAWSGIRPLAIDPNMDPKEGTKGVSRDHVLSHNPKSGVVFVSGGKWTTYREMAEDAVDKLVEVTPVHTTHKYMNTYVRIYTNIHTYTTYIGVEACGYACVAV